MLADQRLKSGFTDETDRRRGELRTREQRREPSRAARNVNWVEPRGPHEGESRAARNVNWGRAPRAARRGIAGRMRPGGRRLVTSGVEYKRIIKKNLTHEKVIHVKF